tara:strand:- start:505 stop:840 length:336 start_codon:yes stop_codon:yes gene_type:complete
MTEINLDYYINKAPTFMKPVLKVYAVALLEKEIENIDSYFRKFIAGDYNGAMEVIIINMTTQQAIDAGTELNKAWAAANQQNMEEEQFKQQFLAELWSVLLNVALASMKVV